MLLKTTFLTLILNMISQGNIRRAATSYNSKMAALLFYKIIQKHISLYLLLGIEGFHTINLWYE